MIVISAAWGLALLLPEVTGRGAIAANVTQVVLVGVLVILAWDIGRAVYAHLEQFFDGIMRENVERRP
jgi:hypothetical protein